jgi:hypothetical protein
MRIAVLGGIRRLPAVLNDGRFHPLNDLKAAGPVSARSRRPLVAK